MTAAPAYSATPAIVPPPSDPMANGAPYSARDAAALPADSNQPGSFASLLHQANDDARSGDDAQDEANRNPRTATMHGDAAVPVIQQTPLPIAGLPARTSGTSAAAKNEHAEEAGAADQKASPVPGITLLMQNISAVNVTALRRPGETQSAAPGGVPDPANALREAASANTAAEVRDSSLLLTPAAGSSKSGSDSAAPPATPTTGETNAPVSSSPLAFAARLSPQSASTPAQPQTQPDAQPMHADSAAANEPETVSAIQTAAQAGSSSAHTGADPNGGQQQKTQQPALSTLSAAYQRAETTRPDSVRAPEQAAESRAAEIEPSAAESANNTQVRDVHMQLTGSENQRVDVRVLDRGGELRVSVRADDPSLVRSLQDNMADLSTRLDQAHFRSEIWTPRTEAVSRSDSSSTNGRTLSNGNESFGQNGQGRQQNGRQNQQPAWMDDFEETTPGNSSGGKR